MNRFPYNKQIAWLSLFSLLLILTVCQRTVEPALSDEVTGVYDVSNWCINNDTLNGIRFVQSCSHTYQAVLLVRKVDANQIRVTARRYAMYKDEYRYFDRFSLRDQDEYKMTLLDSLGIPIGNYYKVDPRLVFTTRDQQGRVYYMASQKRPN